MFLCILFLSAVRTESAPEDPPLAPIIPQITPGELLIRLTPEAAADLERLHANAPIVALHTKHNVESLQPLFPYLARPSHNPNLKRIYLLRFAPDAPLDTLKIAYEQSPFIEAVEYNYLRPTLADAILPNDPKYPEQWSLPLMKLPQAWAIEKGNREVVIAIIDSGIDYTHDDLAPKVWINRGEVPENGLDDDGNGYVDDIYGWDFTDAPNLQAEGDYIEGDNEPIDEKGHGTHVAGIAGAMPDNGIGIAGVAWDCPLMAIRAGLSLGGSSRMQDDDSAAALVYAGRQRCKRHQHELGQRTPLFRYPRRNRLCLCPRCSISRRRWQLPKTRGNFSSCLSQSHRCRIYRAESTAVLPIQFRCLYRHRSPRQCNPQHTD